MSPATTSPLAPGRLTRLRARASGLVPLVVWLAAAGAVAWLYARQSGPLTLRGLAPESLWRVAPVSAGRVVAVAVELDGHVQADQIVAQLDGEELALDLRGARAELERLRAELDLERSESARRSQAVVVDGIADLRRFHRDVEGARIDLLEATAAQEEDRVRAAGPAIELRRERSLAERSLAPDAQLTRVETEHDALEKRITTRVPVLDSLRSRLAEATERLDGFLRTRGEHLAGAADLVLAPRRWSIEAQQVRIEVLAMQRTRLFLRAPGEGRVHRVMVRAGEVVAAGEPVVEIVGERPAEIVAFVLEGQSREIAIGTPAVIQRVGDRRRHASRVLRIGAALVRVPERVTGDRNLVQFALPIYLACPEATDLRPGESVTVHL